MTARVIAAAAVAALAVSAAGTARAGGHQLGVGVHFLSTVGDIKDEPGFDSGNFTVLGSYKYTASLMSVEADVEFVPDFGGSDEMMIQPQAYLLVGGFLYGGAGIGFSHFNEQWLDDPFYALRAGLDIPLGGLHLDVNANYRFLNTRAFDEVDESDLDSVTFGASVRVGL